MKNTINTIKFSIYGHGRGWCFTPKDFMRLDTPQAVRKALSRLEASGFIRRISWGLYEYPKKDKLLGLLPTNIGSVMDAITRNSHSKILPSGAFAANLLGLSNQVPGKMVFLTNGPSRIIKIGKIELIFKRTTLKNMDSAGTSAGIVIQALKHLGKEHIDDIVINKLKKRFSGFSKKNLASLKKHTLLAPCWIRQIINDILETEIRHE